MVPTLVRALEDPDRGVRFAAANGLGKLGPGAASAVPDLARAVADREWCVRLEAVWALGRVGEAAAPEMRDLLLHRIPSIRIVAARCLYKGKPGLAEETLLSLLEVKNRVIGIQAAGLLVARGSGKAAEVLPLLTKALLDSSWVQLQQAREILQTLGPRALPAAKQIARWDPDDDKRHRMASVDEALVAIGEGAIPAIEDAIDHVGPKRQVALRAVIDRIREKAHPPPEKPEVTAPDASLPKADEQKPVSLKVLVKGLSDDDPVTRETTIFALVDAGAAAVPHLIPRLIRTDHRAQALAARTLGEIGPAARMAVPALLARLGAGHVELRIRAALALGRIGDAGGVHGLGQRLLDPERDVRVAASIALGSFDERGVPHLRRALGDENWRVRRHALESLALIGPDAADAATDVCALLADDWMMVGFAARKAVEAIGRDAAYPLAREVAKGHYGVLSHAERIFEALGPECRLAAPILTVLLAHEDVNLREAAARALGCIGPSAAAAVPHLIESLRDPRIGVRDRAALALGRIGRDGLPDLLNAATHEDARVRAGAVFALGWIAGEAAGFDQAPVEFRLPVAEPGPIEATGFAPTAEQMERARSLRGIRKPHLVIEKLADLTRPEQVGVLRAGLRTRDLDVAVPCAGSLVMDDLDGWESERAVELLLPDCASKDGPNCFGDIYEYLGSAEIPAVMHHYRRASATAPTGPLHRLVRADLLPELYRLVRAKDPVITPHDGDVWMPASLTDRNRLEEAEIALHGEFPEVEGPGLPAALVGMLQLGDPLYHMVHGWLNDSKPGSRDAELLISLTRRHEDNVPPSLVRALGKLDDEESLEVLRAVHGDTLGDGRKIARAALIARGDREAMLTVWREWAERAPRESDLYSMEGKGQLNLDVLLDLAPEFGAVLLRDVLLNPDQEWWVDGLEDDFESRSYLGLHWEDTTFLGFEAAAFKAKIPPERLAWIAITVPGCRTKRIAARLLDALSAGTLPPDWIQDEWLTPFLETSWPDRLRDLLRDWSRSPDGELSNRALLQLLRLGDPASATRLIAFASEEPGEDDRSSRLGFLSRSACPEVVEFLWRVARDDSRDSEARREALVELLECRGLPESISWHFPSALDGEKETEAGLLSAARAGDLVEGILSVAKASETTEDGELSAILGNLRDPRIRAYLRKRLNARDRLSYAMLLGQLALCGDRLARRELWAGLRMGRYRWICYQNDNEPLSLGWAPETLPFFLYETESNCCRGGHCARLLGELMADTHVLGYMAFGIDGTPFRAGQWWMSLYGGRFVPTRFTWDCYEAWTTPPEW